MSQITIAEATDYVKKRTTYYFWKLLPDDNAESRETAYQGAMALNTLLAEFIVEVGDNPVPNETTTRTASERFENLSKEYPNVGITDSEVRGIMIDEICEYFNLDKEQRLEFYYTWRGMD